MSTPFHTLAQSIPRLNLTSLPSPVIKLSTLSRATGQEIYAKQDGFNSIHYAGNKVRKLEFLLAQAAAQHQTQVVTLGSGGSNHAVATSTYAQQLGMDCTVCMVDQPTSAIARDNLLRHLYLGTKLIMFENYRQADEHATKLGQRTDTCLIPLGGSSPLASLGFVFAATELAEQIAQGELPMPHRIYVACGTMGTAVGLVLGFALLRLPIQVVAVRVTEPQVASPELFASLYKRSFDFVKHHDPLLCTDLQPTVSNAQLVFCEDYFGTAYGVATAQGQAALERARHDNLKLDLTYTGKAMAALIADAESGQFGSKTTVFWQTLNAVSTPMAAVSDHHLLGPDFARYFE